MNEKLHKLLKDTRDAISMAITDDEGLDKQIGAMLIEEIEQAIYVEFESGSQKYLGCSSVFCRFAPRQVGTTSLCRCLSSLPTLTRLEVEKRLERLKEVEAIGAATN